MMQCTKVSKATHIDICHFATLPEMEKWKEEEEGGEPMPVTAMP